MTKDLKKKKEESTTFSVVYSGPPTGAWLDARRASIGASESPAILGLSSWASPMLIFADKLGLSEEKKESKLMRAGKLFEKPILRAYREESGRGVAESSFYEDYVEVLTSDEFPFLSCTLDGRHTDGSIVEVKFTGGRVREWKQDGPPRDVWCQIQHQLLVTGETQGTAVAMFAPSCEIAWYDIDRDDRFIEGALIPGLSEFWDIVSARTGIPDGWIDGTKATTDALFARYPQDDSGAIELDGSYIALFESRQALEVEIKQLDERKKKLENKFRLALAEHQVGVLPDGSQVSWQTQSRAAYDIPKEVKEAHRVDDTILRVLRFKPNK